MDANKQGKDSVLSDKDKLKTGTSHPQHGKSEQHAKEEIGHMGEKTREASQGEKK